MLKNIWKLSAIEAHKLLRNREVSASEILASSIDRIEEVDKELNALPEKCFDRAKELALRIDNNPSNEPNNLLGIPIAVKD